MNPRRPDLSGRGGGFWDRTARGLVSWLRGHASPVAERVAESMSQPPPGKVFDRLPVAGGEVRLIARDDGMFQFLHYSLVRNPPKLLNSDVFAALVHESGHYASAEEVRAAALAFIDNGATAGHVQSLETRGSA